MLEDKPKYELGQRMVIRSMGINLPAVIVKRIKIEDIDTGKKEYRYGFKHETRNLNIENPWSWEDVTESNLSEMIRHADNFQTHYGKNG
jgi:hypothetical protein